MQLIFISVFIYLFFPNNCYAGLLCFAVFLCVFIYQTEPVHKYTVFFLKSRFKGTGHFGSKIDEHLARQIRLLINNIQKPTVGFDVVVFVFAEV